MRKQEIVQEDYLSLSRLKDVEGGAGGSIDKGRPSVRLLLDLALKLNSTFVNAGDLDDIFRAVLVGATAGEGLGFNRAFLLLVDEEGRSLKGKFAIGPDSPEEAGRIWGEIEQSNPTLFEILDAVREELGARDSGINRFARSLLVSLEDDSNIMVRALKEKSAFLVDSSIEGPDGARSLMETFGSDQIAVVPLFTHDIDYGVIVADNIYSREPITQDLVYSLHLFASLASMAICQSHICKTLEEKVAGLEQLNREVEESRNILVELESLAVLGRMVDKLFHEIRNPLTVIGGITNLLKKRGSDGDSAIYLDAILNETKKIEKVLVQVAEFGTVAAPEFRLEDINALIRSTVALLKSDFDDAGIVCHLNLPHEPVLLNLDRGQLQQAFLCVMKNAVEAMPDGGMLIVSLSVDEREGMVAIRITDTGLGIAKGHFKRVDNPFFTTKINALGLGLSKAKQIVEQHGGGLCLEPNRVGGTTCFITMPLPEEGPR